MYVCEVAGGRVADPVTFALDTDWNLHEHLGGHGPWIAHTAGTVDSDLDGACVIDQVHMLARHAERYPTTSVGRDMAALVEHLAGAGASGPLAFVSSWRPFLFDPARQLEELTRTGPHAGTASAFAAGVSFASRYAHLHNVSSTDVPVNVFSCTCGRVRDTAALFAAGFFGLDSASHSLVQIPDRDPARGGDTLTPGKACPAYLADGDAGRPHAKRLTRAYLADALAPAAARIGAASGVNLTAHDVFTMHELCAFELLARDRSPWCSVFEPADWDTFEYSRDLLHYYRSGPGTPYAVPLGRQYVEATSALLADGPAAGSLFFSFAHDGDLLPVLTALGLFGHEHMPAHHVQPDRLWRTSSLVPMAARIVIERSTCASGPGVRILVNDGALPLPGCPADPAAWCPLDTFLAEIGKRLDTAPSFADACGLSPDVPSAISFLRQPAQASL
ncbi:histidine phosphatase superfamily [Dipodascopsis tothii]|uniref:histidine phosphatase superfamily n=1 Tax=Dipodascopsis tothii TaxID=44089 RepID=UPI0034CEB04F